MDEVAEVSDELMERYLEGEEISHEETVGRAQERASPTASCSRSPAARPPRNLGTNRLLDAFVEDLPSPAKKGAGRARRASTLEPERGRRRWWRSSSRRWPTRSPGASTCSASSRACSSHDTQVHNCRAHVKERVGQLLVPQGKELRARRRVRPRRHRRRGQAQGDPRRRCAVRARRRHPAADARDAAAGDGLRHRAQDQGRRGQGLHRAAPPPGGGPDDRRPPRRADRRADRGRPHPDARGGDRRTG